mgnify:CR=1 FL=1
MAKKYKVKTAAVFDGQPVGSIIELDEATAKKYEALKYLEIVEEVKQAKPKAKTTKKAATTKKKKDE